MFLNVIQQQWLLFQCQSICVYKGPRHYVQYLSCQISFQVSQLFQDKELYIVNGPSSHSKAVLEKKVAEVISLLSVHFTGISWADSTSS